MSCFTFDAHQLFLLRVKCEVNMPFVPYISQYEARSSRDSREHELMDGVIALHPKGLSLMRVAIIHYWLVGMRGGEKVVEQLCRIFPDADVFAHVVDERRISPVIAARIKSTTFISRLPLARRFYKWYLPFMPWALEQIDLRGYDLIISSESGPAKGILAPADALHVCYCHSPMRYIWAMYQDYMERARWPARVGLRVLAHYLRMHDVTSAARVDRFIANSHYVARRIRRCYNRDAEVIYPPVDTEGFGQGDHGQIQDFYLMVGELVSYKRFDLGITAFNAMGKKLIIVGAGEAFPELRSIAGEHITLLGAQPLEELRRLYATCRALIFPGEEDFGIVPVEAMAAGRPVIAFRKGGATESVEANVTGLFFDEQTVPALCDAVHRFERREWNEDAIRAHAAQFGLDRFHREIQAFVERAYRETHASPASVMDIAKPKALGRPRAVKG